MNKKNRYILKTLLLVCLTAAPSFYLLSSYYTPRIPVGKRPQGYTGPRTIRQKRIAPIAPQQPIEPKVPVVAEPIKVQKNEKPQESEPKPTIVAETAQAQMASAPQGWLAIAYASIAPLILVTLNKALGGGIDATNKSLVKKFMTRQAFEGLKNHAHNQASKMVQSGEYDREITKERDNILRKNNISKQDPEYTEIMTHVQNNINIPKQEKINLLTKNILKSQKINVDQMEKETTLSSIMQQGVYVGMLNTIIPMMGSLIGFGATMALQALMPAQSQK